MRTRRSPRNQERLFKELFKPPDAPQKEKATPIDLKSAWWLSARAKKQIEADRIRAAHKEAMKRALSKSNPKRRRNAGGSVDTSAARELELFVENDSQLYNSQEKPIQKNLITKMARGVYNHAGAVKLYGYLMESGAKKYNREYGGGGSVWHEMFNTATRKAAAERFASHFEVEAKLGNYDGMLPKKYQKKSNPAGMLPRDKWISGMIRVTKGGKIEAKIPRRAVNR